MYRIKRIFIDFGALGWVSEPVYVGLDHPLFVVVYGLDPRLVIIRIGLLSKYMVPY